MKPIGGYFEWEFSHTQKTFLHNNALPLNSGRHALEYILRGLPNVQQLWVPYFTCDVILQPLQKLGISWKFYHINQNLEISDKLNLAEGDFLLYTNYYGIKDEYCKYIAATYGSKAIIDNAQALFCKPIYEVNQFYSPRKFIGMPDGGLAVTMVPDYTSTLPIDSSFDRCSHLLKRIELAPSEGYADFKENSKKIAEAPLGQMSPISKSILANVNLDNVKQKRRENFTALHNALAASNKLKIPPQETFECSLIYPYWINKGDELKKKLIAQNIFVATYWPNVFEWANQNDLEYTLANQIVCLPIDQRYSREDMEEITRLIQ